MDNICNKYNDMIFDFIDGELSESNETEFTDHIENCAECTKELDQSRKTLAYILESAYVPPAALKKSILAGITTSKKSRFIKYGTTIAACIIGVAVMFNFTYFGLLKGSGQANNSSKDEIYSDGAGEITYAETQFSLSAPKAAADLSDINNEMESNEEYGLSISENDNAVPAETQSEPIGLLLKPSLEETAQGSAVTDAATVALYSKTYAPEYADKVFAVAWGKPSPAFSAEALSDGSNYTSFTLAYSEESYSEVVKFASDNGITVYKTDAAADDSYVILYVLLKD